MKIIRSVKEMKAWSKRTRDAGQTIGFVPTMGFLHAGHMSLVRESLRVSAVTVVSIFVNARQFGPDEDLDTYPTDIEGDKTQLASVGADVLFYPAHEEIYPQGHKTYVRVNEISDRLCGASRPVFLEGVATVVLKLLNIVQPHKAFFGEKDRQQLGVVQAMVRDLNLDVSIKGMPIVRDPDGLALSSRNQYLSEAERKSALALSKALKRAQAMVLTGEVSVAAIKAEIGAIIEREKNARIDYIALCDPGDFAEKLEVQGKTLVALAVHIGATRLIDNCILGSD